MNSERSGSVVCSREPSSLFTGTATKGGTASTPAGETAQQMNHIAQLEARRRRATANFRHRRQRRLKETRRAITHLQQTVQACEKNLQGTTVAVLRQARAHGDPQAVAAAVRWAAVVN